MTAAISGAVSFGLLSGVLLLTPAPSFGTSGAQRTSERLALGTEEDDLHERQASVRISAEELASALNDRRSLRRMFFDGQEQWLDTLVHLDDPAFTATGRLRCSAVHGGAISACLYRITMVISPLEDGSGEIIHAEANLVDPRDSPSPEIENHPDCEAFTQCIAGVRVGEVVPIPRSTKRAFALEQLYQSNQANSMLFRPEKVREAIAAIDETVSSMGDEEEQSAREKWRLRKLRNTSRYLRHSHLRRLEEQTNASRSSD